MRKIIAFIGLIFIVGNAFSQGASPIQVNPNANVTTLVQSLFSGCIEVSNITFSGNYQAIGSFSNGLDAIGLESGLIMSTGKVSDAAQPNYSGNTAFNFWYPGSSTYATAMGLSGVTTTSDAAVLEFDVVPYSYMLTMNYVFASEGYPEYLNTGANEGPAILVTGPIPMGGAYADENLAFVPTNGQQVCIDTVNSMINPTFFQANNFGSMGHTYDGYTVPMQAVLQCTPCQTYHFKIILADIGTTGKNFDSAIFLEAGGIKSDFALTVDNISFSGGQYDIYEGCTNQLVIARMNQLDTLPFPVTVTMSGSATDSVDYSGVTSTTYIIPMNTTYITIDYTAILDNMVEGTEIMHFTFSHPSLCDSSCFGTYEIDIEVLDNFALDAGIIQNDTNICSFQTSFINLETYIPPDMNPFNVFYQWNTGSNDNQITVQPPIDQSTTYICTITDVCGQEVIDSVTVTNSSFLDVNVGIVDNLCFGDMAGEVSVLPQGGFEPFTYVWTPAILGTTSTGNLDNLLSGNYSVTVSDSVGCVHQANFYVDEPDSIYYSLSPFDPKCNGDSNGSLLFETFNGVPPFSYHWNTGDTTPSLVNIPEGIYSITAVDQNGCEIYASDTLVQPAPLALWVSPTMYICKGQNITLSAGASGGTPTYFYFWSNGASGPQITVNPTTNTIYTVYVQDLNGCTTPIKQIQVNVYPDISVQLNTLQDSICQGESTTIHAQILGGTGGPYTTVWTDGSNSQLLPPPYTVSPAQTTQYEIFVDDFCGSETGYYSMTIYVFDPPEINITSDIFEGCKPLSVSFDETLAIEGSTYDWNFGDGVFDINHDKANPSHTYVNEGIYDVELTLTSPVGCKNTKKVTGMIEVFPVPTARFYPTPAESSIIKPIIFFDNVSTGADIVTWDFGDGSLISNSPSPEHYFTSPGEFLVQLLAENTYGCRDTFYQTVVINNENTFYTPNAFSPNSEIPENRNFRPVGLGVDTDNYHLIIYDRWGNKVYETFDFYRPWNGVANGKVAQEGTVFPWVVIYKDINGQEHQESGTVIIVK